MWATKAWAACPAELVRLLLIEPRYGLFVVAPITVLAFAAPWLNRPGHFIPSLARDLVLPCLRGGIHSLLRLRAIHPAAVCHRDPLSRTDPPFLFLAGAAVLLRLPRWLAYGLALVSFVINWSISMVRSQGSVMDNLVHVFVSGFQLPWLTVLGKTSKQYLPWLDGPVNALPFFVLLRGDHHHRLDDSGSGQTAGCVNRQGTKVVPNLPDLSQM